MTFAPERYASRRDTLLFVVCLLLSIVARILPSHWGVAVASVFRDTLLSPLIALQYQAQVIKTSRARYDLETTQRDSLTLALDSLAPLRFENRELRALLGLRARLPVGHVAVEILHQAGPGEALLTLSAGRAQGIRSLQPVISTDGLVGVVTSPVDARTSVMMVWAHPDFRASAMTEDGAIYGIVAPSGMAGPDQMLMELSGVPYREHIPEGTAVYTSGLGGVYPRGIPVGRVIGVGPEGEGWSRTYIVRPAVQPASVSHVIVLTGESADLRATFRAPTP
ncbi:MAG: rod shape-determining protein MreC [Gemmatimonadetes bacterium]|nr:rod shape-determining protein MreC [Gemmatimonadota bacterium]